MAAAPRVGGVKASAANSSGEQKVGAGLAVVWIIPGGVGSDGWGGGRREGTVGGGGCGGGTGDEGGGERNPSGGEKCEV